MNFPRPKTPAKGSAAWRRRAAVATASGIAFLGTAAVTVLGAATRKGEHLTTTLTGSQSAAVANGAAEVQNNEWGSSQPESIATNGNAGFTVANSSIATRPTALPAATRRSIAAATGAAAPGAGWPTTRSRCGR